MGLRRTLVILVMAAMVVSILVIAGALWAKSVPKGGDFSRCLSTCNTMVNYYAAKRPTLKAHEGDSQCWQTCNTRFNQNLTSSQDMKGFWLTKRDTNLHANQCAQSCWRHFHKGANAVNVAGYRSEPRNTACTAK